MRRFKSGRGNRLVKFFKKDKYLGRPDYFLLGLILFITAFGLVMLSSASSVECFRRYNDTYYLFRHQLIIGLLPGLILFFMDFFTDHRVTFYNENLLLANPLTLLFIPLGIGLIVGKKISIQWLPKLWYLLASLNLLLVLLKILPSFDQQNWLSISLIVPLSISMLFSWYLINKSK